MFGRLFWPFYYPCGLHCGLTGIPGRQMKRFHPHRIQNIDYKLQNTELIIWNTVTNGNVPSTQNTEYRLQITEYRINNMEYCDKLQCSIHTIQITEYRMQNTEWRIKKTEYRRQNTQQKIQITETNEKVPSQRE